MPRLHDDEALMEKLRKDPEAISGVKYKNLSAVEEFDEKEDYVECKGETEYTNRSWRNPWTRRITTLAFIIRTRLVVDIKSCSVRLGIRAARITLHRRCRRGRKKEEMGLRFFGRERTLLRFRRR